MRRSSRALAFEQTFYPMTLITRQPLGNLRAWCLQNRRQLPAGAPLRIQHYRLQPLVHAIGSIPFRLFAQSNQPLIGARTQMNHSGKHGTPPTGSMPCFYLNVPLFMRACIVVGPNPDASQAKDSVRYLISCRGATCKRIEAYSGTYRNW